MKKQQHVLVLKTFSIILLLIGLLATVFSIGSGTTQTYPVKAVVDPIAGFEQELEDLRSELRIPGMSAAIAKGDSVIWSKGFGWANKEQKIPVTPESIFHLASLTKPYAATIILQLIQEGKLDLYDPVSKFGLEMENADAINLLHLLTHTSSGAPGTKFKYDGKRFGQLEEVIEKSTGNSFSEELSKRILLPLDLKETAPNPLDSIAFMESGKELEYFEARFVNEYARKWGRFIWPSGLAGPITPIDKPTYFGTAAGLVATAREVARFSGSLDQGKLLEPAMYELSMTPFKVEDNSSIPFGLSWFLEEYQDKKIAWQYGHWFGSSSLIVKIPQDQITFVILSNSDGLSRNTKLGDAANLVRSPLFTILEGNLFSREFELLYKKN